MHELKPDDASVSGEAAVIRAEHKLQAAPATLRATVHVTRAGTGKVDTFEIVGTPAPATPEKEA
jgi:transcription elongation GreA/GreB family factor